MVSCEVVRHVLLPREARSAPKDAETCRGEVGQLCGRYSWHQRDCFHLERASGTGELAIHQILVADRLGDLHPLVIVVKWWRHVMVKSQMRDGMAAK